MLPEWNTLASRREFKRNSCGTEALHLYFSWKEARPQRDCKFIRSTLEEGSTGTHTSIPENNLVRIQLTVPTLPVSFAGLKRDHFPGPDIRTPR